MRERGGKREREQEKKKRERRKIKRQRSRGRGEIVGRDLMMKCRQKKYY